MDAALLVLVRSRAHGLCTAIVEIALSLRRNVAVSRLPIAPFLAIRICFGFRASDFRLRRAVSTATSRSSSPNCAFTLSTLSRGSMSAMTTRRTWPWPVPLATWSKVPTSPASSQGRTKS